MNKTTARLQYIKTTKDSLSHLFPQASVAMVLFWTSKADFGSSLWIRKLPKCFNKTVSSTVGSLKIKKRVKIKENKRVCVNHSIWWEQFFAAWAWAARSQHLLRQDTTEIQTHDSLHLPCYPRQRHGRSPCLPVSQRTSVPVPSCPTAWSRPGDPKTCWPHCEAESKHTPVMPPARTDVGQPSGSSLLESKVPAWVIPRSCQEAFWKVAPKAPKEMSFKRRCASCGGLSVNTIPGHL